VSPARRVACSEAYGNAISSQVVVLAVQEIINRKGNGIFVALLPGSTREWRESFADTPSSHDNGIYYLVSRATVTAQGFLYEDSQTRKPDRTRVLHPARWAHIHVDDFDFTIISLHLTYKQGDTQASKRELLNILDWLDQYFKDPASDPDVILAGDFNLPSSKGKALSKRKKEVGFMTLKSIIQAHGKFLSGPHKLTVLIDEPTSRSRKGPGNNYDHFILTQSALDRLIKANRLPIDLVDKVDAGKDVRVSDHYPVMATFCADANVLPASKP
jgi:endonuclease/exonuclease/phosphatase family metal-dependent hydrolase